MSEPSPSRATDVSTELDLKKVLATAQLPALPQSAMRLLELSQNPENGPVDFAIPIEADPGLTGQVLRFVNSSYFGFTRKVSSISLAINLVGIRTIKNFALWSAVFSLMPNPRCGPFDLKRLWQDSLRRAIFARAVGQVLGIEGADEPFAAALLQDMAIPLLAKESPQAYTELLNGRDEGRVRLSGLEHQAFDWDHATAAGMMARQWNLPDAFSELIEGHTRVDHWAQDVRGEPGRFAVALSAMLPSVSDPFWHEATTLDAYYDLLLPFGAPQLPQMLRQVDAQFEDFAPVLQVATPSKSLADSCREAAEALERAESDQ
jgi:HD-like signal output (HDOD) protein